MRGLFIPEPPSLYTKTDLLSGNCVHRYRCHLFPYRFIGDHDQCVAVTAHNNHAPTFDIKIPFCRISQDLLKLGEVKASQTRPISQVVGPNDHLRVISSLFTQTHRLNRHEVVLAARQRDHQGQV